MDKEEKNQQLIKDLEQVISEIKSRKASPDMYSISMPKPEDEKGLNGIVIRKGKPEINIKIQFNIKDWKF